jgi:hypothetical protein
VSSVHSLPSSISVQSLGCSQPQSKRQFVTFSPLSQNALPQQVLGTGGGVPQSTGQLDAFSPASQTPLPQLYVYPGLQSKQPEPSRFPLQTPSQTPRWQPEQVPAPATRSIGQSCAQVNPVSPWAEPLQMPSPQTAFWKLAQSNGQVWQSSPIGTSHLPLPQYGLLPRKRKLPSVPSPPFGTG